MSDYEPLDLTTLCNAGPEMFGERIQPPVGAQTFHGLPFQIGPVSSDGETGDSRPVASFLGFGQGAGLRTEAVRVPIERAARRVIFAHALLESDLMSGGPLGRVIAHYLIHFADGEVVRVPIRERFELAVVPLGWGQFPFLAVPDRKNSLAARYEGRWDAVGFRQTEASQGTPRAYYLWAWENPRPETTIAAVEIVPEGPRFVVAGITMGHVDEDPLCRAAAREVVVTLPRTEECAGAPPAEKKFSLEVEVDRGVATYPYPLPADADAGFLADGFHGWGEARNPASSPAYVEIAATPSATVTVKQEGEELGRVQWGKLEKEGALEPTPRLRIEVVGNGRNWVHTTVLDDETGKPVPCRIHFRSPRGIPYAPHGHHPHLLSDMGTWHIDIGGDVRLGQVTYAYIDGKCQGWLPRGEVIVDVARGYEYEPLRTRVQIAPGQRQLTLRLKRVAHMNRERYFSGDTHVHFLSTQGSQTEARGEDLNVVNLLQSQWGHLFTNTEEFTGRPNVSPDGQTIVYATQENRQHLLGHLTLLGLKEPVMPWCSDGPGEAELGGALEVTLSHWADACHAQGGTVVIPHLPNPNCEPATLIATGRADAVEMLVHSEYQHLEYYRYLNCGYRLPLVGGTDKMTSDVPVGIYRTYVYIPPDEEFTYDTWCKALRGGNTFLSGGPLLRFTVNGEPMGSTLRLGKDGGTVEIEASAQSVLPIHSLEIVSRGKVVAATEEKNGTRALRLRTSLRVDDSTWLAARCAGIGYQSVPHHDGWHRGIMGHTSPVYVACGGDYQLFDLAAAQYMLTLVDGGLSYIRHRSPQHRPADVTHHHGEADHMAYLESPFHEAHAAIHKRMHELGIPH
jgi:hypothetical protein